VTALEVRLEDCPWLIELDEADTEGGTSLELTVTPTALELTASAGLPLSVTWSSNCQLPMAVDTEVTKV
jgi:hypothetical protein